MLVVGLDWFLINPMNRVMDIDENLKNGSLGTERVARQKMLFTIGSLSAPISFDDECQELREESSLPRRSG